MATELTSSLKLGGRVQICQGKDRYEVNVDCHEEAAIFFFSS